MTGLFVTFEGIDGSGKSTQIERCAEALRQQGLKVVVTRNPGGTVFGQELRQILLHSSHAVSPLSELLLFMADRAQHMEEVVLPALEAGKVVLCDRHGDSTVAYQGYGRGLSVEMIEELNRLATQGHLPHLTILLDASPERLAARVTQRGAVDRMEGEAKAFHDRVRDGYLQLAKRHPERIQVLNADTPVDALHQQVMALVQSRLPVRS